MPASTFSTIAIHLSLDTNLAHFHKEQSEMLVILVALVFISMIFREIQGVFI